MTMRSNQLTDDAGTSAEVTDADLGISAQARAMGALDWMLDEVARRAPRPPGSLLDVGCGMGALTRRIATRLGIDDLIGIDNDADRLREAAGRGIRAYEVDLEQSDLPVPSGSVGMVTCFGVLAYLTTYDRTLSEAARVLEDGGWLMLSMPNLGSRANRMALLLGYQPNQVDVSSKYRGAGTLRRRDFERRNMPPLLHAATLRCMKELLDHFGFDVVVVRGFNPRPGRHTIIRKLAAHVPSWSRRFVILARKHPTAASDPNAV